MPDLSIVVFGASGDLARKKIYPALFSLYSQGYLPENIRIFGFARTRFSVDEFRSKISENITCRYVPAQSCAEKVKDFLGKCLYVNGDYHETDSMLELYRAIREAGEKGKANRVYFMALSADVYAGAIKVMGDSGLIHCGAKEDWTRVVIEKPFGKDSRSSAKLIKDMGKIIAEEQVYRIDHYLGKQIVQDLMVLRFANSIFEPLWCRHHIENVRIDFMEDFGCEGRGGYFDSFGIIRDVIQNHLLQLVALTAMEKPKGIDSRSVRNEKVRLLKKIRPAGMSAAVIGQYTGDGKMAGYRQTDGVRPDSLTPTYASVVLKIENDRWRGVPFLITAGKALKERKAEIRVRFKEQKDDLFDVSKICGCKNELIIRIQPDESIKLKIINKAPSLNWKIEQQMLDLTYKEVFTEPVPDAYESLLLDVIHGDRSLFIRKDELAASWDVFTPLLKELDAKKITPEFYRYGSVGPDGAGKLAGKHGFNR